MSATRAANTESSHAKVTPLSPACTSEVNSEGGTLSNSSDSDQAKKESLAISTERAISETNTVRAEGQHRQQKETMLAISPNPVTLVTSAPADKRSTYIPTRIDSTADKSSSSLENEEVIPALSLPMPIEKSSNEPDLHVQPGALSASSTSGFPAEASVEANRTGEARSLMPSAASHTAAVESQETVDTSKNRTEEEAVGHLQKGGMGAQTPATSGVPRSESCTEQRQDPEMSAADRPRGEAVAAAQEAPASVKAEPNSTPEALSPNNPDIKRKSSPKPKSLENQSNGRWTLEEHEQFLEGLKVYGREWKKVAQRIPTRTSAQIRSHAQKYFAKLAREEQQQEAAAVAVHGQHVLGAAGVLGVGDPSALLPQPTPLSSSARQKADRIIQDPAAVRQEVEHTLAALRERYQQLQERLEAQIRRQGAGGCSDGAGAVAGGSRPQSQLDLGCTATSQERQSITELQDRARMQQATEAASPMMRRKRVAEEMSPSVAAPGREGTDRAPTTEISLPQHREFGNGELIALSVLGGSLPQSGSRENLMAAASSPDAAASSTAAASGSAENHPNSCSREMEETAGESRASNDCNKRHRATQ